MDLIFYKVQFPHVNKVFFWPVRRQRHDYLNSICEPGGRAPSESPAEKGIWFNSKAS